MRRNIRQILSRTTN